MPAELTSTEQIFTETSRLVPLFNQFIIIFFYKLCTTSVALYSFNDGITIGFKDFGAI